MTALSCVAATGEPARLLDRQSRRVPSVSVAGGRRLGHGVAPPPDESGPRGTSRWQVFWAAWNCGELGSTPVCWPLAFCPLVILMRPELSGSGKFGTPCLRMHPEYAAGPPLPEPEPLDAAELVVLELVEESCATFGRSLEHAAPTAAAPRPRTRMRPGAQPR